MQDDYKEFTGKNLDEAMADACAFFGVERGKLEIEILSDAKSGIFGLVGAKKAVVRARRVRVEKLHPLKEDLSTKTVEAPKAEPEQADTPVDLDWEDLGSDPAFPSTPVVLDQDLLHDVVLETVNVLTRPIVGDCAKTVEISGGKVRVRLEGVEDCGLLIGREGQTLAALRYLAGCIVSRRLNAQVRVQIDAGDYQERQEERLRSLALSLADKAKENGLPRSTRPLGAYQRRIVHLTLQNDQGVKTYSKGEGRLKRVIVIPARNRRELPGLPPDLSETENGSVSS